MESLFLQSFQRALAHDQEIFIFLQLLYKTVKVGKVLRDLTVDQCDQKRSPHILHTFKSFLIIIQISQGYYKLIIFILLNVFLKLCLIIKIHGNQANILGHILQNICMAYHFSHGHPLHGHTIDPIPEMRTHLGNFQLIGYRKLVRSNVRKNCADIFFIKLISARDLRKDPVGPDHTAFHIHNGIGKCQFFQHPLFHHIILIGKCYHIIDDQRFVISEKLYCDKNINNSTYRHQNSGLHTYNKHQQVQQHHQNRKIQWPAHEVFHRPFKFDFVVHCFFLFST